MDNKVELIGHYGSDELIALAAWTSTSRELPDEKRARIPQLITKLWNDGHQTPFERGIVQFLVTTDIATHIHLLKHRIGVSVNGESARYKELVDKFYIPKDWDVQVEHTEETDYKWSEALAKYTTLGNALYHQALQELTPVLGRKRAKESARFFKPYNTQIQADVTFNLRSFAHFLKLRNSEHAQLEVREVAQEMVKLVQNIEGNPFKTTLEAWGYGVQDRNS